KKNNSKIVKVHSRTLSGRWYLESDCVKEAFDFRITDTIPTKPINGYFSDLDLTFNPKLKPSEYILESDLCVVPATKAKDSILVGIIEKNFTNTVGYYILLDK